MCVLVTAVVFLLWVTGCLLFSAPLACMGHLPWSACLPLQLLQSLQSSLRHGPHLFSVNLFILARISLRKRGQNKPHVSFNDILKISITGRFLYYIKYACVSKRKVYEKKRFLIVWYSPFSLKFTSQGVSGEGFFWCSAFETDCSQCSSVPTELKINFLIISEPWQF